ncbi:uncharacterized protein RSE6_00486 [Rhynchosporium secalis]|uniref:Uncharacterized protein n=1 Tax=Rhynchosporium secalis TaxID=38038 RepID=A0A1E1LVD7_RHYSE|nr:uncharacterized protein RSE6_00486 [Rhynchosporium secalis]
MLIHSGSGYHVHEYSRDASAARTRLRSKSAPKRSTLARSAFSAPLLALQTSANNESHSPILRQPLRTLSENITPVRALVVRFQDFDEDEEGTMSEDAKSMVNSEGSITTAGGRRSRKHSRSVRTSTTFCLAHPAPSLAKKQRLLQIRPRLLLQLQQLSTDARPKPYLDVLPSTVVVPRLYKKFPRMFRGKDKLGCHDVMLVKSEDYETDIEGDAEESDSDEDGLAKRDLVAVICQVPKDAGGPPGQAEIVLSNGSIWIATPLPGNVFEFILTDKDGTQTTTRWVRKSNTWRSVDTQDASFNGEEFRFSIINPSARQHPILATMTQATLNIPDSYTTTAPSAKSHLPTSSTASSLSEAHSVAQEGVAAEKCTVPIDQALRTLIQVTGVWLALRKEWSPYFNYNDTKTVTKNLSSSGRARSMSHTPESGRLSPTPTFGSTESGNALVGVLESTMRRVSAIGSPSSGNSPQLERILTSPKRSVSTGTAFMQRNVARRVVNQPSTIISGGMGERVIEEAKQNSTNGGNFPNLPSPVTTTPASFGLPASTMTPPDTPTRLPNRPQSYVHTGSLLMNNFIDSQPQKRHSMANFNRRHQSSDQAGELKTGRWKSFANLFRRKRNNARLE